jgi:hypothetical protein
MIITIKYFGITYSIETEKEDLNATEMIETFTDLNEVHWIPSKFN